MEYNLEYYIAQVLKSRRYGSTYKHVAAPAEFNHGDICFSLSGFGRSLQGGGNKWKAYAHRDGEPVTTKELQKLSNET